MRVGNRVGVAVVLIAVAGPALAGPFEDAVAKFTTDDFSDSEEAVDAIAASGNPLAFAVISALKDERLMFDADSKKVYIKQDDGKAIDAATGAPVDAIPDSASSVSLNNKLRRHIEAACPCTLDLRDHLRHASPVCFSGGLQMPDLNGDVCFATDPERLIERIHDRVLFRAHMGRIEAAVLPGNGCKCDQLVGFRVGRRRILQGC